MRCLVFGIPSAVGMKVFREILLYILCVKISQKKSQVNRILKTEAIKIGESQTCRIYCVERDRDHQPA